MIQNDLKILRIIYLEKRNSCNIFWIFFSLPHPLLYRTLLGRVKAYLLKPKKPLSQTNAPSAEPSFSFKLHGWLVSLKSRTTLPSSVRSQLPSAPPRVQAPMRFLLALPVVRLPTPIELPRPYHKCDEWFDERPNPFRLDHQRDHRIRSQLSTHCLTDGLPCRDPLCADEECVLCIIHRGIAVTTHLLVSFLKAPQVRVETPKAWERLRQIKADLSVFSV